jgi:hypothetical protein
MIKTKIKVLISESTRPLVKKDSIQRINVIKRINRDSWSMPYLPYMKSDNLSLKLMIKTPFKNKRKLYNRKYQF